MFLLLSLLTTLLLFTATTTSHAATTKDETNENPLLFAANILGIGNSKQVKIEPQQELKIIGAGFPRSATKSTKAALTILGYKVFHTEDLEGLNLGQDMLMAMADKIAFEDFTQKILSLGYNATLDGPGNMLSIDWSKRFPKAKVLFTIRDSEKQWAESFDRLAAGFGAALAFPLKHLKSFDHHRIAFRRAQMELTLVKKPTPWYAPWVDNTSWKYVGFNNMSMEDVLKNWSNKVRLEVTPSDRVLFFNVRQGWGPLCKFLNVKEPVGVGFPHVNEAASIEMIGKVLTCIQYSWPFIFGFIFLICCWVGELVMKIGRVVVVVICGRQHRKMEA
jgi:hypothetical protein